MNHEARPATGSGPVSTCSGSDAAQWLVACSNERTLVARRQVSGTDQPARVDLVKIFETGTLEEARAELQLGAGAKVPGLVVGREVCVDAQSGKPCLLLDYIDGQSL